jgi:hypothetical protein
VELYDGQRLSAGNDEAGGGTAAADELEELEMLLLKIIVESDASIWLVAFGTLIAEIMLEALDG